MKDPIAQGKKRKRALFFSLVTLLVVNSLAFLTLPRNTGQADSPSDLLTRYTFDPVQRQWVSSDYSVPIAPNPDGSLPARSHTIEILLEENEPVKAIVIAEALITRGTDPLLEIAGRSNSGGSRGDIRFCNLALRLVDAKRLEIRDTEAVRVDVVNTVAKDNELDMHVSAVNVVRCGRGANTVIALGIDKRDVDIGNFDILDALGKVKESGLRVDRIRILGPEGRTGFVEHLVVVRTSVFGEIEIRDVKIQRLLLDNVSLDDSVAAP
ncbi:MAG: hypothetical protein HY675_18185 [Chloroflexi bacterium]|nr:hypothetical protein [Chloroflexota bacterium]